MLRMGTQVATALALLELDGVARKSCCARRTCRPSIFAAPSQRPARRPSSATGRCRNWPTRTSTSSSAAPPRCRRVRGGDGSRPAATEWALFTSGTTGPPKLALHYAAHADRRDGGQARDRRGLEHVLRHPRAMAACRSCCGRCSAAARWCFRARTRSLRDFFARVAAAGVTFLSGTPTHWRRALLCPLPSEIAPPDVRLSGEVADQAILDKLRATYPDAAIVPRLRLHRGGRRLRRRRRFFGFPADWVGATRNGVELRVEEGTLRIRSPRAASRYLGEARRR